MADALDRGALDATRFRNYSKMRRELAHLEREQDLGARLEEERRTKRARHDLKKFNKRA